jgi:NADPH:quinone reductase-like Zn-dependent oxidoreductase
MLIHKPEGIPWDVAAGISETWATAIQAMYLVAKFLLGKSILWHAGASSVSLTGIQLSKAHGASAIYATAGSQEKIKLSESVGATKAWKYHTKVWAKELDQVREGKGVDIVIDFIGPDFFQININSVALDGQMAIVCLLSGNRLPDNIDIHPFVQRRIRVEGSRLRSRSTEYQGRIRDMLVKEALLGLTNGQFIVPIDKVIDWNQIQEAHELVESNSNKGKIVCRIVR